MTTQSFGPRRGDALYEVKHAGAVWRFSSKESSERFAANPDGFTPAYGGFCANALALGEGAVAAIAGSTVTGRSTRPKRMRPGQSLSRNRVV